MRRRQRVLFVAPMPREAKPLSAEVCGAGAASGDYVERRLQQGDFDAVVIAGVCGGLDPSLSPGSLILGRRVLTGDGRPFEADHDLFEHVRSSLRACAMPRSSRAGFVSASLLSVDAPYTTQAQRTDAWNTHGAAGVDMETYAVVAAAERAGVRWIALRSVLDPGTTSLPPSLASWRSVADEQAIMRTALRRPLEWPAYARLALQMRSAMSSLRRAAPLAARAVAEYDAPEDTPRSRVIESIALV